MKKSAKKTVPAPVAPIPDAPPPVWRPYFNRRIENRIDSLVGEGTTVAKFQAAVAAGDIVDAIRWNGEQAIRDASIAHDYRLTLRYSSTPRRPEGADESVEAELVSDAFLYGALVNKVQRIEEELLGSSYCGVASRGPWSPNSTSAGSNLAAIEVSNGLRTIRSFYKEMIEDYEARRSFDAALAGSEAFPGRPTHVLLAEAGFKHWTEETVKTYHAVVRDREAQELRDLAEKTQVAFEASATIDPDAQCPEHGCLRARCAAEH